MHIKQYAQITPITYLQVTSVKEFVYADPPYTRDHYSRFYHVLETLALRDDPRFRLTRLTVTPFQVAVSID